MKIERNPPSIVQRFFGLILIAAGLLVGLLGGLCTAVGIGAATSPNTSDHSLAGISLLFGVPVLLLGLALIATGFWLFFVGPKKRPDQSP